MSETSHATPTEATERFFTELDRRGYEPLLEKVRGLLRIDLHQRGEPHCIQHWLMQIDRGTVRVSRAEHEADSVVSTDPGMFDRVVRGEDNAVAAMLRGAITVRGDLQLVLRLERLFPGPPSARGPYGPRGGAVESRETQAATARAANVRAATARAANVRAATARAAKARAGEKGTGAARETSG